MGAALPYRGGPSDSPIDEAFLLKLAAEFEAAAGAIVQLDPDDPDVQDAVADRLAEVAARDTTRAR
jgi:hypothetical protein